jgi:hypothetical protein
VDAPQKPTAEVTAERASDPSPSAAPNDQESARHVATASAWDVPAPAEARPAGDQNWGTEPRASADLWPSPDRSADPWGTPGSAAGVAGEPSREGYAAWDAAPSSWIGWNAPSKEEADENILLESPDIPAEPAEPTDDQDETAPFAWPGEPGSGTEEKTRADDAAAGAEQPAGEDAQEREIPEPEPTPGSDEELLFVSDDEERAESSESSRAQATAQPKQDDVVRDGWDAYIAARESARAQAAEGDVVAKGMSLVEQLRDLLPAIVLSEPATMRRVANDLINARNEANVVPQEDLDRLRGVLESSRENPRDIDALMQLGRHATELLDLMESFERYTGAVDRAVAELSRGGETPAIGGIPVAEELPPETDSTSDRS